MNFHLNPDNCHISIIDGKNGQFHSIHVLPYIV